MMGIKRSGLTTLYLANALNDGDCSMIEHAFNAFMVISFLRFRFEWSFPTSAILMKIKFNFKASIKINFNV